MARAAAEASPSLPTPRPLRPLLRLRRLPDRALATVRKVLDEDDVFRSVVAAATTEELVGAPSWLFLQRPDGWETEIAAAVDAQHDVDVAAEQGRSEKTAARRLAAVETSLRRAEERVAALRAEVAEAKARLAEERRARRAADTEAGRLRRRVADLEKAAGAGDELAAVRGERDGLAAEVVRLRAELESVRRAETRPAVPDTAAVERALSGLDRARDELAAWLAALPSADAARAAPARSSRSRARRRPAVLPPAVFDDTVEAAEHLVRVAGVLVLVDGYNVTKQTRPELTLPEQRRWLLDALTGLASRTGAALHVVFDGAEVGPRAPAHGPRRSGVHVRYTEEGVEADDDLLALLDAAPVRRPVVVVSDDRRVRTGAAERGANVVGSGTLADLLRR